MEQPRILSILQAILWAVVLSILVRETQGMQYYILQCMARSSVFIMDINILPIIKISKMIKCIPLIKGCHMVKIYMTQGGS